MIDVESTLRALSLSDKCRLVAGRTNWRTYGVASLGIPELKMSDGPNGVRGEGSGSAATPGVVVPAGITLGASWDTALLAEIGDLLGRECERKHAHVLLGPTVNLHRTPIGGRTFECYSEDPELSGGLAAAYIRGVQSHDVAVTVKHFVCNDTEIERLSVDVRLDERTLRELYLRPFELAVRDGGAWGVMSAYNRLQGEFCAENRRLLTSILRDEWGFDGVVVSDWFGVHDTIGAADAGLDIEMPGPPRVYGAPLEDAVERGDVSVDALDALVRRVLALGNRVHASDRPASAPEESLDDPAERALTRRAAVGGTVLVRNAPLPGTGRPALPMASDRRSTVAVIGPNAVIDRCMGGGSASLQPFFHRTFLDALRDRLGDSTVTYDEGVRIDRLTPVLRGSAAQTPDGAQGLRVDYFNGADVDAPTALSITAPNGLLRFFGTTPEGIDPRRFGARVSTAFVPDTDGDHTIGVVSTGPVTVTATADGREIVVVDDPDGQLPRSEEFFGYGSEEVTLTLPCRAGVPVALAATWRTDAGNGFAAFRLGVRAPEPADLIDRAAAAAAAADTAIVVVGTNDEWETEGFDRTTMALPGRQDELVERVVAANPNTIVIVNAGSPVTMDWAGDDHPAPAPAVLVPFFAGQEQAEALVDIVLGDAEPGGRLPVTFPKRLADTPAYLTHRPDHGVDGRGVQRYGEGLFVGHRWYEARGIEPRFWFGHGLGYGSTTWGQPTTTAGRAVTISAAALAAGESVTVTTPVTAGGERDTTVVVQGYVAPIAPIALRPVKHLAAFAKRSISGGATVDVELRFGHEAFRRWDERTAAWVVDPGDYDLVIAASAAPSDERGRVRVTIGA